MPTKTKKKSIKTTNKPHSDGPYILKLTLFLIVSSMWLHIQYPDGTDMPLPLGALIALIYASHEHFQIDRKIEYMLILLSMFVAFWLPIGIFIQL